MKRIYEASDVAGALIAFPLVILTFALVFAVRFVRCLIDPDFD